jgi:hypothetical protein
MRPVRNRHRPAGGALALPSCGARDNNPSEPPAAPASAAPGRSGPGWSSPGPAPIGLGRPVVAQDSTARDSLRPTWRPRGLSGHLWIETLGPGGIATQQLGEVMSVQRLALGRGAATRADSTDQLVGLAGRLRPGIHGVRRRGPHGPLAIYRSAATRSTSARRTCYPSAPVGPLTTHATLTTRPGPRSSAGPAAPM